MNLPEISVPTRRLIVLGVILLALCGAWLGEAASIPLAIGGLLGLIKDDKD